MNTVRYILDKLNKHDDNINKILMNQERLNRLINKNLYCVMILFVLNEVEKSKLKKEILKMNKEMNSVKYRYTKNAVYRKEHKV